MLAIDIAGRVSFCSCPLESVCSLDEPLYGDMGTHDSSSWCLSRKSGNTLYGHKRRGEDDRQRRIDLQLV